MISIIIPSRTEKYLDRTIRDVQEKATTNPEIIVVLDGYDCERLPGVRYITLPPPVNHERRKRQAVNAAVSISQGKYVCWLDAHCAVAPGFDEVLLRDSKHADVLVPSMYALDLEKWDRMGEPDDYRYWDLKNGRMKQRPFKKEGSVIDDILCSQGSFFFMKRTWFNFCEFMNLDYTGWGSEGEEICLETLYRGGRVVVDKNTWYAHLSKAQMKKRMYKYVSAQESYDYAYNLWVKERGNFFNKIAGGTND